MEEKKPLSQYGIGPYYAALVFSMTLGALLLDRAQVLPALRIPALELPMKLLAAVCVLAAALLWVNAVFTMNIAGHIRKNELVTSGAYAWVRNPIYSAIMLLMWGLLSWNGDPLLLLLCPVYHLLMSIMVKHTEEKWLRELYGEAYLDYCKRVPRCIPWFPKGHGRVSKPQQHDH